MQKQTHKLLWLLVGLLGLLLTGCAGSSATTPPQQIVIGENTDLGGYDPGTTMSVYPHARFQQPGRTGRRFQTGSRVGGAMDDVAGWQDVDIYAAPGGKIP